MVDSPVHESEDHRDARPCDDRVPQPQQSQTSELQHTSMFIQKRRSRAIIIGLSLVVTIVVIFAVVFAYALNRHLSPSEVLTGWIDCLNTGDARGAADLTIYSRMDLESYLEEVDRLEEGIRHLGTDEIELKFVEEVPKEEEIGEEWFSGLTYMKEWLDKEFGIIVEDHAGVCYSFISYGDGAPVPWVGSMPVFKVDNSWYLAYGLWYP